MATAKKATKKAKERSGLPPSPTEDLTDHSTSAAAIAESIDGEAGAQAKSIDAVSAKVDEAEDAAKTAEDNSLAGKIRQSGLFMVHNHVTGENYVGISPQNDPDATQAEKRLSAVIPLDTIGPRTGMIVKPKDGDAFTISQGYGPDSLPRDWAAITRPDGNPLFG